MSTLIKIVFMALLSVCSGNLFAADRPIEIVSDIASDAADAQQNDLILIVLVTLPDCTVCEHVKAHYLEPMIRNGALDGIALVREVGLAGISFTDFDGAAIEPTEFAHRYAAAFSPSVLFLAPDGTQLHEPLIGMESRDFYGFYLDKAIAKSSQKIRG